MISKYFFIIIIMGCIVFSSGCIKETPEEFECFSPFKEIDEKCCIDDNNNNICDFEDDGKKEEDLEQEQICTPNSKQCSGNNLEQCNDDGLSWTITETCEHGCNPVNLVCDPEPEPEQVCVPDTKECSDINLRECNTEGLAWTVIETCEYGCDSTNLICNPAPEPEPPAEIDHTQTTWATSVAEDWGTSSCGRYADITIDKNDNIHVVQYINAFSDNIDGYYYKKLSNGVWSDRSLIFNNPTGTPYSRIVADENGGLHVAFQKQNTLDLRYSYMEPGGIIFFSENVHSTEDDNLGQYTSLAVDGNNVYISYLDRTDYKLFLAYKAIGDSEWTTEEIQDANSEDTSIVVENNVIHIAFVDKNKNLKYIYRSVDSSEWSDELVDTSGRVQYPSLALDSSGTPHIAYHVTNAGDGDDGALMFSSRIADGAWSVEPEMIDDHLKAGTYASLAFDGDDALISYHVRALAAEYIDSKLKVAIKNSGTDNWITKTIESGGNSDDEKIGTYSEIAIDSTGRAHVVYYYQYGGKLKYAVEE